MTVDELATKIVDLIQNTELEGDPHEWDIIAAVLKKLDYTEETINDLEQD